MLIYLICNNHCNYYFPEFDSEWKHVIKTYVTYFVLVFKLKGNSLVEYTIKTWYMWTFQSIIWKTNVLVKECFIKKTGFAGARTRDLSRVKRAW